MVEKVPDDTPDGKPVNVGVVVATDAVPVPGVRFDILLIRVTNQCTRLRAARCGIRERDRARTIRTSRRSYVSEPDSDCAAVARRKVCTGAVIRACRKQTRPRF